MKLQGGAGNLRTRGLHIFRAGVDKQQHGRDKRGQALSQLASTLCTYGAGAGGVEHQANGIHPGVNGGVHIGFAGEPTNLDAGAAGRKEIAHGSQSYAGVRSGRPQWLS